MKNYLILVFLFSIISCSCDSEKDDTEKDYLKPGSDTVVKSYIPGDQNKLVNSYPDFLDSVSNNFLYWRDGTKMIYDDGNKSKSHDKKLNDPDIEDMLSQEYISGGKWMNPPPENFDPGRIRYEPFFLKMYGDNSKEVSNNLVNIEWVDGSNIKFTKVNGASKQLIKIVEELKKLPDDFRKYLVNPGGTFLWRNIAGTSRLSNHSFGNSIDINTKYSDYWLWSKSLEYKNRIPMEIVEIFEKHGFIWGGKWYHYDTMHFEYRPELIN